MTGPEGDARPDAICQVRHLEVHYPVLRGVLRRRVGVLRAVDGVSFEVRRGETLGLVGESGSGKSTLARAILRLEEPTGGRVLFEGADLTSLDGEALRRTRRHLQMIFQDPYASLNPRHRVRTILREPLDIHGIGEPDSRRRQVLDLLDLVGLEPEFAERYPHELSGGQRQRIGIARALSTRPAFVVADEPVSALDVSIQAQILNLLADLRSELGLTYLLIAHDLAMVHHLSDRVAVLYLGRLAELGERDDVFGRPLHPYTRALISAIPVADPGRRARGTRLPLQGEHPDPTAPPPGCRFHTRCPFATDLCRRQEPELRDLSLQGVPHLVACHHAENLPTDGEWGFTRPGAAAPQGAG